MQQIITAKLKLLTTPEQQQVLRQAQLAYRAALNYVSRYAYEHGKLSNAIRLRKETYREVRTLFKLPSMMACNVPRQVAATYKGLWTKLRQNHAHRKKGYTKRRYKGLDKPPKYVSPTLAYSYGLDYSFKTGQRVSIMTLQGRLVLSYQGYDRHVALIHYGATIRGAKLWYDRQQKQFYLLVSLKLDMQEPRPEALPDVVGVDVGMRNLATTATLTNQGAFYWGKRVKARADHYARLRKRLQKKGTRSATRRLVALSGRERRLKLQANHTVAKSIVEQYPHSLIGLEELTGIRRHTKRRKRRRRHGERFESVSVGTRRANRQASNWAFAELHSMLAYKALLAGSLTVKVDADYTSKACPLCGHTHEKNRPENGLLFSCTNPRCGYTLHADLVGARNIAMRTLCIRQDWIQTGQLSFAPGSYPDPDISDDEAKAARLARYAELRWSPGRSHQPQG